MANPTAADRLAAEQRCLYGTAEHYCGAPATLHVLQAGEQPTMSCAHHAGWWGDGRSYIDSHPIAVSCGMPGARWVWSWPEDAGPSGRCAVDVGADVDAPGLGLFGFLTGLTAGLVVAVLLVVGILGLTVWTGLGGLGFAYVCGAAGGWAATRRSSR